MGSYVIAGYVNSAFACEVFLKTILLYYGDEIENEHKLKELWMRLKKKKPNLANDISDTIDTIYCSTKKNLIDTILAKKNISNTYCHCRYIYEQEPLDKSIVDRLKEKCCEMIFDCSWREFVETAD